MNKTLEYMAFGLPVVAFDLTETRVSAGGAAVYADGEEPESYAAAIVALLDDPERRARLGAEGRRAIESALGWPHQAAAYRSVYQRLLGTRVAAPESGPRVMPRHLVTPRRYRSRRPEATPARVAAAPERPRSTSPA